MYAANKRRTPTHKHPGWPPGSETKQPSTDIRSTPPGTSKDLTELPPEPFAPTPAPTQTGPPPYWPSHNYMPGYPIILPLPGRPIVFPVGRYPYPGSLPFGPGPVRPPFGPGKPPFIP